MSYVLFTNQNVSFYAHKDADVIRLYAYKLLEDAPVILVPKNTKNLTHFAKLALKKGAGPRKAIIHDTEKNTFTWNVDGSITRFNKTEDTRCTLGPATAYALETAIRMLR